eukprot:CAMPEP_0172520962 /NCGR_PEP_ID=MMETSP1066-20121228/292301_1 /TAXON_ID=671091 /ORGANISM="Coscinodiscus wailesii, Strain CCMP2513" /LENGTH=68 /DNA_ID=CAMNT_0013303791 /DNA_START=476 /DNA_END=682 /DNA_ORIENTATION=+
MERDPNTVKYEACDRSFLPTHSAVKSRIGKRNDHPPDDRGHPVLLISAPSIPIQNAAKSAIPSGNMTV